MATSLRLQHGDISNEQKGGHFYWVLTVEIIHELMDYWNQGVTSESFKALENLLGKQSLRCVVIQIADWLAYQNHWPRKRPLNVPSAAAWRDDLKTCLDANAALRDELADFTFDFRIDVDEGTRNRIRQIADDNLDQSVYELSE